MKKFQGQRILVTGACGTVGSELIRQLLNDQYDFDELVCIDNNESSMFFLEQQYLNDQRARFYVGDVRDRDKICRRMKGIDVVFHAAALKHVVMCERSPFEAVQTNIHGVQNIIYAAYENNVSKVIFTSSDKAVNPTNVMGTSKLMGERLITAANNNNRKAGPIFASTRFGNVLGSNGSVIPIFHNQIAKGGPVTITDYRMTRFVMSIRGSVHLVLDSAELARGGEVFITKMPVIKIHDLATAMIDELSIPYGYGPGEITIQEIGAKPGEKLYEELMSEEETGRAVELPDYFVILPAFRKLYHDIDYNYPDVVATQVDNPYVSSREPVLTVQELRKFMRENGLLNKPSENIDSHYWSAKN